ncbi:hypothetical protein CRM22_002476 [Opisthorchis felineus]|uniref:FCP1 homology domain-containing protein n=1 Tax=Opisthorchis felineus TaxID=147828 RepID=A0A4S2M629_OPIFE|nr:hypothetical protein CRM22_002476 [Opisthorchis felineus]
MPHLNTNVVSLCSHLTPSYCQNHRKLILVCDMDETLITEVESGDRVVVRPKICYMLKNLRPQYELCLVTYSTRERTDAIVSNHLDPDAKIFGNRILCREDILPHFKNKLDAFLAHMPKSFGKEKSGTREVVGNVHFRNASETRAVNRGFTTVRSRRPPVWTYIVALDDFPLAWSNLPTCIPVRPFLLDKYQRQRSSKNEAVYVLSLQKFLMKLHNAVFQAPRHTLGRLEGLDNKSAVELSRHKPKSAYSVITRIRRRPSQVHRFQSLCHLDPGRLIDFDVRSMSVHRHHRDTYERSSSSLGWHRSIAQGITTPPFDERYRQPDSSVFSPTYRTDLQHPMSFGMEERKFYGVNENDRIQSSFTPSKQLIRHVYRRARLIPGECGFNHIINE